MSTAASSLTCVFHMLVHCCTPSCLGVASAPSYDSSATYESVSAILQPARSFPPSARAMSASSESSYLGDPLCVPGERVQAGPSRQSPHLHSEVCRATHQDVQLVIVVDTEH